MLTSTKVRKANQASARQIQCALEGLDTAHHVRVFLSAELGQADRDSIWTLFESNMFFLYSQSSFGWNPSSKRDELFSSLSRFILVDIDGKMAAFSMFRFEHEEDENVIYCYDLQIQSVYRRKGLGKMLMQALEKIGAAWGMEKVMLTVFKANKNAVQFYKAAGFTKDETCPGYVEEGDDPDIAKDVDYEILSKKSS